jgi:hypothetical protein
MVSKFQTRDYNSFLDGGREGRLFIHRSNREKRLNFLKERTVLLLVF